MEQTSSSCQEEEEGEAMDEEEDEFKEEEEEEEEVLAWLFKIKSRLKPHSSDKNHHNTPESSSQPVDHLTVAVDSSWF